MYVLGLVQAVNSVSPSNRHSYRRSATASRLSLPVNVSVADESVLGFDGFPVMDVSGGVPSVIVQL